MSFQYQFGDYYFCLAGKPYSTVTLYDKDGCLLSSRFLVSGDFSGTHGNLRRPLLDRGYYDRRAISNPSRILFLPTPGTARRTCIIIGSRRMETPPRMCSICTLWAIRPPG